MNLEQVFEVEGNRVNVRGTNEGVRLTFDGGEHVVSVLMRPEAAIELASGMTVCAVTCQVVEHMEATENHEQN